MANNNVHDRHPDPNEDFDAAASNKPAAKPTDSKKTTQEVRDAHFLENGVNADGTTDDSDHFDAAGKRVQAPPKEAE